MRELGLIVSLLIIVSLVSADFGYDNPNLPRINREIPTTSTSSSYVNYSANTSNYWDNYDTPLGWDIDESDDFSGDYNDLANKPTIPTIWDTVFNTTGSTLWCKLTGCNLTGNLYISNGGNLIINATGSSYFTVMNTTGYNFLSANSTSVTLFNQTFTGRTGTGSIVGSSSPTISSPRISTLVGGTAVTSNLTIYPTTVGQTTGGVTIFRLNATAGTETMLIWQNKTIQIIQNLTATGIESSFGRINNLTVPTLNAGSCDVKASSTGNLYCGTDATESSTLWDSTFNTTGSTLWCDLKGCNFTGNVNITGDLYLSGGINANDWISSSQGLSTGDIEISGGSISGLDSLSIDGEMYSLTITSSSDKFNVDSDSVWTDGLNYIIENGNVNISNGNITALYFKGDGSLLTNLPSGSSDGNASSICDGNETYLSGDGSCNNISILYYESGDDAYFNQIESITMISDSFVSSTNQLDYIDTKDSELWNFIGFGLNISSGYDICIDGGNCLSIISGSTGDGNATSICSGFGSDYFLDSDGDCVEESSLNVNFANNCDVWQLWNNPSDWSGCSGSNNFTYDIDENGNFLCSVPTGNGGSYNATYDAHINNLTMHNNTFWYNQTLSAINTFWNWGRNATTLDIKNITGATNTSRCDATTGKLIQVNLTNGVLIGECGTDQTGGSSSALPIYKSDALTTNHTGITSWTTLYTIPLSASTNYTINCYMIHCSNITTSGIRYNMSLAGIPDYMVISENAGTTATAMQNSVVIGASKSLMPIAVTASLACPAYLPDKINIFIDGNVNTGGNAIFQFSGESTGLLAVIGRGSYCEVNVVT